MRVYNTLIKNNTQHYIVLSGYAEYYYADVIPCMAMLSVFMCICYGDNCNPECQYAD